MNQRIAPSERITQEMNTPLQEGIQASEQPLSQFIRLVSKIWCNRHRIKN